MGPKRQAKSNGSTASPAKRAKKTEKSEPEYRWEFEGDKQTWTQYSSTITTTLTQAFTSNKKQVDFTLDNGVQMSVNFGKSVQKNKKSGWERPVRLAIKDDGDSLFYVWCWNDDKDCKQSYGAGASRDLEQAHKSMESKVSFTALGRPYEVDLSTMEQENTETNVIRQVVRIESKAIKCDPGAAEPVASSSLDTTPTKAVTKATSGRAAKATSGRGKVKAEPMEDEEEELPKTSKSGGKSKAAKSGARERPAVKTVVMSGKAPVDPECTMAGKVHVYYEGSDIYDCMLNQTNVSNNNNKYFLCQVLEEDNKKMFYTWFRWGRVGYGGQNNLVPCGPNVEQAKKTFMKKFQDKTRNAWADRKSFVKVAGKYDLLAMDYSAKDTDEVDAPASLKKEDSVKVPDSKLDKRLQSLVELICDVKVMEDAVMEMQYDAKKAPLGKLTTDQIKAGYAALKVIDACIEAKDMGSTLNNACNDFYTRIPHDFGMRPPSKITTKQEVKKKIELLEALGDIQIAIKMLKQGDYTENPVDRHYHSLKCDLEPIDHSAETFKIIDKYLQNTHATTHNMYKMKILDLYDVSKHGEKDRFNDCGNRMLLWHGSRLSNWVGILSQGLRIAPPEAPVTGYMFGKGVYFADMSSKSANYCFASRTKSTGLLLLCEVALGSTNDLLAADYAAAKMPAGKHSVKGAGKIAPDPKHTYTTDDGVLVPYGKSKDTGTVNPKGYTLNYNEFIVYDTKQIKMKYLVKVQFKF